MLLLQDFDVESSCLRAVERGYKPSEDSTTKRLEPLLTEAGVDLNSCYFTNRFVGVRDADNQYGANPAWRSPNSRKQYKPYVTMSDDILRMQLEEQRPKLVLTYGTHVPRSLGLATVWKQKLIASATFLGHSATVAALLHPSFRSSNIPQIKYRGLVGHDAEVTIIKEALAVAGLSPGGGTQ